MRKVEAFLPLLISHFQLLNENKYIDLLFKCLNLCGYVIPGRKEGLSMELQMVLLTALPYTNLEERVYMPWYLADWK